MTNIHKDIEKVINFYNKLLNSILPENIGFFRIDEDGNYLYVDDNWSKITGISSADALNKKWYEIVHSGDSEKIIFSWENNKKTLTEYFRCGTIDDREHWVKCCIKHIDEEALNGYIGLIIEITSNIDFLNDLLDIKTDLNEIKKNVKKDLTDSE